MFIALTTLTTVRSSGAPCAFIGYVYIPLLTERDYLAHSGYREFCSSGARPHRMIAKKGCPASDSLCRRTRML